METTIPRKIKKKQTARLESALVQKIRHAGGLSRVELAREIDLAPSTAGVYVNRLLEEGILLEGERQGSEIGRPRLLLTPNPAAGHFIGIDFEAHNINAVAVDFAQGELARVHRQISPEDAVEQILERLAEAIEAVRRQASGSLLGIGVGVPGLVDPERGVAIRYSQLEKWENIPLSNFLSDRFGVPVSLENNVRAMALAELKLGKARSLRNFVLIALRSGVGGAIVVDGQIYRGTGYVAGEIGQWRCPRFAGGVPLGEWDLLENIVSVPTLLSAAAISGPGDNLDSLIRAFRRGESVAVSAVKDALRSLGWALVQLCYVLSPQQIILCGPLTALGKQLTDPLQSQLRDLPFIPAEFLPQVKAGEFHEFQGALGATAHAISAWRPAY